MSEQSQTRRPNLALAVLCLAAFMASLDLFIVNVAFDAIGRSFHGSSLSNLSWVLNAYAIVYAAMLVPLGRLADRISRRSGFLIGVAIFTLASAACAVSDGLWMLVGCRILQAVGAALLTPTSLGLVVASTPIQHRMRAVRIWAASGALAAAAGPVVGGLLVAASWRWVFLVNVPIGALAIAGTLAFVPRSNHRDLGPIPDLLGALMLVIGIGGLSLGLVQGPDWGWLDPRTAAAFVVAVVTIAIFVFRSARHHSPIVEPALLRVRSFASANITAVAFSVSFAVSLLSIILWMQDVWQYSALRTGLAVAPGPLMVPIFAAVSQRLSKRLTPGQLITIGCALFSAGSVVLLLSVGATPHYATEVLPGWLIGGIGVGFTLPTLLSTATADLPADRAATGSGVINMSRQVGTVLGVSLLVAIVGTPIGYAQAHLRFSAVWWMDAGVGILAAVVAWSTSRPHPRRLALLRHADGASQRAEAAQSAGQ